MKKSLHILILFCLSISNITSSVAQSLRYGLEFSSFDVVQEKRTSLSLSPSKAFSFPNGFSLSFNLLFQSTPEYNFGYIFRIIGQNNQHLDFLVTPEKLTVVNSGKMLTECGLSEASNNFSSFFPVQSHLDVKNNLINIVIGEKLFSHKVQSLKDFEKVRIVFGRCDYPFFQTSDVPKMTIKDIRINNVKGNTIYYWQLSKHSHDGVYDELENYFAKAENARWLLNDHVFWNKEISFKTMKNPQTAYNFNEGIIAIADRKDFVTYNTNSHKLIRNENSAGFVQSNQPNQMIYNQTDNTFYSYCFYHTDGRSVASYDSLKKSWNNNNTREFGSEYWHHNRLVSPKEDCLYLFGGYGQHRYKDEVNKYSFKTEKWEKELYEGDPIDPRYLSGLGIIDENNILLFGGYGNSSGIQSLSPKNYYDLYQIHLPDLSSKKIWEMQSPSVPFVVANSMIVDKANNCFYALCFPQNQYETSLTLVRFSIQKPEYEIVSNSIPFYFNDILSYADLFHNKETNELYAITSSSLPTDSLSTVSIYSLSYPPLAEMDIYQSVGSDNDPKFVLIGIFILLLILAIICYLIRIIRKKRAKIIDLEQSYEFVDDEFKIVKQIRERNKKQAIFLFGGFLVKDNNGNDITAEFSPMLRQLFLIILLNTLKEDGKGISSTKLDETLWPNKNRESARNNRSVMISKIRQLFENVGNLSIESSNSYWVVKLGNDIYCDYCEAFSLIHNIKRKNIQTKEEIIKLLDVVSFGELLPNLQVEWIDPFKANFANKLIDLLVDVSKQKEFAFSPSELVYLADTILIYDILNDDALKLKCCALVKMGKNGLAKSTYNSFVRQYSVLFGTRYNYTFDQVIS